LWHNSTGFSHACVYMKAKVRDKYIFDIPIYYGHSETCHKQCKRILDANKMSINHNRQYFYNRCQKYRSINHKIQSVPDFIFPKIYSLARFQHVPSSADEKKAIFLKKQHSAPSAFATECQLPHARNSSIHATLDSQCFHNFPHSPRYSLPLMLVLAGYTPFIPIRFYSLIRPHSRVLASLAQTLPPKSRSGLTIGDLARVCLPPKCLTGPA